MILFYLFFKYLRSHKTLICILSIVSWIIQTPPKYLCITESVKTNCKCYLHCQRYFLTVCGEMDWDVLLYSNIAMFHMSWVRSDRLVSCLGRCCGRISHRQKWWWLWFYSSSLFTSYALSQKLMIYFNKKKNQ